MLYKKVVYINLDFTDNLKTANSRKYIKLSNFYLDYV